MKEKISIKNVLDALEAQEYRYEIVGTREFLITYNRKQYAVLCEHLPVVFMEYSISYQHAPTEDFDILWSAMNSVNLRLNRVKIMLAEEDIYFRICEKIVYSESLPMFLADAMEELDEIVEEFRISCKVLSKEKKSDMEQLVEKMMNPTNSMLNGKGIQS